MPQSPRDPLAVLATALGLGLLAWIAVRPAETPTGLPAADLSAIERSLERLIQTLELSARPSVTTASPTAGPLPGKAAESSPREVLPDTAALHREIAQLRAQVLALSRQPGQVLTGVQQALPPLGERIQRLTRANLALNSEDDSTEEALRQELLLLPEHQILAQLGKPTGIHVSKNGYEMWTYEFKNAQGQDKDLTLKVANGRVVNVF